MLKEILLLTVGWLVGSASYSFLFMQVMLTIFVSMRIINKMSNSEIDKRGAKGYSAKIIIIYSTLFGTVVFLILRFAGNSTKIGFCIGVAIVFLLGLKNLQLNEANVSDFTKAYQRYFKGIAETPLGNNGHDEQSNQEIFYTGGKCPYCNSDIIQGALFCNRCGNEITYEEDMVPAEYENVNIVGRNIPIDDKMIEIRKWKELLDEGILSDEEFARKKREILGI